MRLPGSIFQYVKGYLRIRVIGYSPERFLNACSHRGIYIWGITSVRGSYDMYVSVAGFRKLKPVIKKTGTKVMIVERIGLPFYFNRYKKRKMFFIGAVSCLLLVYILSLFVWDIDVRGNRKYTDEALLTYLKQQGVEHGMRLSQVDCSRIVKDIRKSYDDIIWVSASIEGCRLIVKIKENEDSNDVKNQAESTDNEEESTNNTGTDLVASCDGIITEMIVRKGIPCVSEGDQVTGGQILVSGVVPVVNDSGETIGVQMQTSDADIKAQTVIEYSDQCDSTYELKEYTGQKKELLFLKAGSILFTLGNSENVFPDEDTITYVNKLRIGDHFEIPLYWGSKVTAAYTVSKSRYSTEEIQRILSENYSRYQESLEKKGVEIIENNVRIYSGAVKSEAKGTLTVISDIGKEQPADITSISEEPADGND